MDEAKMGWGTPYACARCPISALSHPGCHGIADPDHSAYVAMFPRSPHLRRQPSSLTLNRLREVIVNWRPAEESYVEDIHSQRTPIGKRFRSEQHRNAGAPPARSAAFFPPNRDDRYRPGR